MCLCEALFFYFICLWMKLFVLFGCLCLCLLILENFILSFINCFLIIFSLSFIFWNHQNPQSWSGSVLHFFCRLFLFFSLPPLFFLSCLQAETFFLFDLICCGSFLLAFDFIAEFLNSNISDFYRKFLCSEFLIHIP